MPKGLRALPMTHPKHFFRHRHNVATVRQLDAKIRQMMAESRSEPPTDPSPGDDAAAAEQDELERDQDSEVKP